MTVTKPLASFMPNILLRKRKFKKRDIKITGNKTNNFVKLSNNTNVTHLVYIRYLFK